ncbi:MAG: ATP-binding cassette domain-containing protein [Gammaproteobacteria bacterium]|nr:ATP-binding cassette domain-containing protein [Gammaproteobacteria bacterium]
MPPGAALVEIHDATIYRGSTCVFKNLNLNINQHEQTAILGPNGAGKTTLLKLINREIYPVAKKHSWVKLLGRESWNVWDLRSQIGIVSDDLQSRYLRTTTGLDVVLSGFLSSIGTHGSLAKRITDIQRERARDIMLDLGVEKNANVPLRRMSTGQQRRCLLARALVHNPSTLILDEPTAGLDLAASFAYMGRIRRLVREGRNIVLVTHHLNEIPPDIGRVILLRQGRIIADGPKHEVLTVENLVATFDTPLRLQTIDDYYLAYPEEHRTAGRTVPKT